MPLRVTEPKAGHPGWVWDRFEQSPPMATYLAAWAVGPLESRNASADGRLRVWGRPAVLGDAQYALDTGDRIRRLLAEWLDEPDPLPKMDLLALPSFVSDALENWGLISFG
ncbi:Aminopeptidase [Gryllus bimaculatus]|nr:Aminopeptidase [Gryllus bimaculatus]